MSVLLPMLTSIRDRVHVVFASQLFEIMQTSALSQSWHMFSPVPTTEDQWYASYIEITWPCIFMPMVCTNVMCRWVMAARLHDKSSVDLFKVWSARVIISTKFELRKTLVCPPGTGHTWLLADCGWP